MGMNLFAQIRKVDEEKRLVYARAAQEVVDNSREIMDYASSKPHFAKWSEDIAKDTAGRNLGNVRAMHGKVAVGGLTQIDFNDGEKAIDVCAKIVDDQEWKKVLAGVYTGLSIGGAYVGDKKVEKIDGQDVTRYTAKPNEVSLVDRPCIPTAKFFEVQKADGTLAKVDFAVPEPQPVDVVGTDEQVIAFGKMLNEHGLTMGDVLEKAMPAFLKDKIKETPEEKAAREAKEKAAETPEAKAAREAKEAEEAEKAAANDALTKLEASIALAKVGARNSGADLTRMQKIHDSIVELGAACGMKAEKHESNGDLAKMVTDAVAPLHKMIEDQAAQLKKLADQPAPTTLRLRAVAKGDEMNGDDPEAAKVAKILAETAPIVDSAGQKHEAAGFIKFLHSAGGIPLATPESLRK